MRSALANGVNVTTSSQTHAELRETIVREVQPLSPDQMDPVGELVRPGQVLGYDVGRDRAEEQVKHATLAPMRARASEFAPSAADGIWRSYERFFRSGGHGEWREIFTEGERRR